MCLLPIQVVLHGLQVEVRLRHVRSWLYANAHRLRGNDDPGHSGQRGLRLVLGQADVVAVHEAGEEEEHLHASEGVAQAAPPAHSEGHEEVGTTDGAIRADEALRNKLFWLVPKDGVHVHALDQRDDLGARGNRVAVHFDFSAREEEIEKREGDG